MRTRSESYRRRSKRAVSPIIATILLVAITVVLAAVLYVLISGYTTKQSTPIGSALSFGNAAVGNGPAPTVWYENLSIQSAASSLTINSLSFQVQTSGGGVVAAPAGSTVLLIGLSGTTVATYTFSTGAWTGASTSTLVTSQDSIQVFWKSTATADPLTGDSLVTSGSNGYQGTISTALA